MRHMMVLQKPGCTNRAAGLASSAAKVAGILAARVALLNARSASRRWREVLHGLYCLGRTVRG
jgi:hypothetical protein